MASGWEKRREEIERVTLPVSEWMVRALDPQPGDTVLELAAGPGGTGFAAAPILGEQGRLISSDFSSEMVEVARRRSTELGLANVEHRVIDAEEMSLEDDSVDGVLCRFGFMLMPDPAAALAETRRVLRPEGRLALAVWGTAAENPWVAIAGLILAERGLSPPPEPGAPGMFVLADEARLSQLLQGAGFDVERVERVPVRFEFDDVDDYIVRTRTWAACSPGSGATPPTRTATPSGRVSPRTTSRSRSTGATRSRGSRSSQLRADRVVVRGAGAMLATMLRALACCATAATLLTVCAVTGSGTLAARCEPTLSDTPGPFQQGGVNAPLRAKIGTGHVLQGRVLAPNCAPVARALVIFWQAGPNGYRPNGRGSVRTDRAGRFRIEGPPRPPDGGPAHIHIAVFHGAYEGSSAATSCAEARRPDASSSS